MHLLIALNVNQYYILKTDLPLIFKTFLCISIKLNLSPVIKHKDTVTDKILTIIILHVKQKENKYTSSTATITDLVVYPLTGLNQ